MASISISVKTDAIQAEFQEALGRACAVSEEMIAVKTTLHHDRLIKTVTTDCLLALRVIRTFCVRRCS